MKLLYSSMSFLYLFNDEKHKMFESLQTYRNLVDFAKPKFIAVNIGEKDYNQRHKQEVTKRSFPEKMKRINFLLQTDNAEELSKEKGKPTSQ